MKNEVAYKNQNVYLKINIYLNQFNIYLYLERLIFTFTLIHFAI